MANTSVVQALVIARGQKQFRIRLVAHKRLEIQSRAVLLWFLLILSVGIWLNLALCDRTIECCAIHFPCSSKTKFFLIFRIDIFWNSNLIIYVGLSGDECRVGIGNFLDIRYFNKFGGQTATEHVPNLMNDAYSTRKSIEFS